MSLSRVDFPQPLGPTTVTNSPWAILKLISSSAPMVAAVGVQNKFWTTFSAWITR